MQQTDLKTFIDLLEVFRLGLHTGIIERQVIIEWADRLVMQKATPNYFLVELSLGGRTNINDFIGLLDGYIGENQPQVSKRVILGCLLHQYRSGQLTLQKAVRAIDWLAIHVEYLEEEHSFMAGVDDDYSLAEEGVCGTFFDIEVLLLRFLSIY